MAKQYKDDEIVYLESDIQKIQTRTTMYISYKGSKASMQLCREIINNAIDEVINPLSPGDSIDILFDEESNMITVSDNGRGIPLDKVEIACTKIQAGSKLFRDQDKTTFKTSAGENGTGITCCNALSDNLTFIIYREGKKGTFVFQAGKLLKKEIIDVPKKEANKHGTTVSFIPSEKYLGKCKIDHDELLEWITDISYLIDPNIKLSYHYASKKHPTIKTIEFKHENGVADMLDVFVKKQLFDPIYINFKGSYTVLENGDIEFLEETGKNPKYLENRIVIQAAYTINPDVHMDEDDHYKSFCNYIRTIDHGVHLVAMKTAWNQLVSKLTTDSLTPNEAEKYPITYEDARNGLFGTLNIMCTDPQFASQTKEKMSNDELFKPIRKILYFYLSKYFKDNPAVLKKVTQFVKANAKARLEIGKIKKSEYKPIDNLNEHTLKCFNPANGNGYRELFIVEGGSAKGTMVNARDPRYQALFAIRGVPKNTFGLKLVDILSNQEFKYLIKILGCGIGKDKNIDKLKYDKIIIFTDSDIDGFRIASLLCTFFLTQYPEIVERGLLYKAVAPLYIVDDAKHKYIMNKADYYRYFADRLIGKVELYQNGEKMTKSQLKNFIIQNNQYLTALDVMTNYYSINPDLIEFIVQYKDETTDAGFKKLLKKKFPEMTYEDGVIKGIYNDAYQVCGIDKSFEFRAQQLKKMIIHNGGNTFTYTDKGKTFKDVTLGQFLVAVKGYMPATKKRLKGLGEMTPEEMWNSSIDPKSRELIQLTTENIELELDRFRTLHGKDSDARKELMKEYVLDPNDIDN